MKKKYTGIKTTTAIGDGMGGKVNVPLFTIFITPAELVQLAEVPSFKESDQHSDLATNLKTPPTKDWQRPLNLERIKVIGNYFGTTSEKRLMPNPILVGESSASSKVGDMSASIDVAQLKDSTGKAVPDVWEITINNNGKPALWILDGQHRSYGLADNLNTKNEKIPVVLLIKSSEYTMQFLAQIFTEVTTGASDLEEIHKNWMQYSFGMSKYKKGLGQGISNPYDNAMLTILQLTTLSTLDGVSNEFYNGIKFNPYDTSVLRTFNLTWNSNEWIDILANNYFKNDGKLAPELLAEQMIRFLRAASKLDVYVPNGSKIFGEKWFQVLLNHLIWQFLQNLDILGYKTQLEWESHLKLQKWDTSDWRILWATGSQSSNWGRYSNRASEYVMKRIMSNVPFSVTPDVALRGPSEITLTAYPKTTAGKKSNNNKANQLNPSGSIHINGGAPIWTTGVDRKIIEFSVPKSGIGSLVSMEYKDASSQTGKVSILAKDTRTQLLDLDTLKSPIDITLMHCCFNEATKSELKLILQW